MLRRLVPFVVLATALVSSVALARPPVRDTVDSAIDGANDDDVFGDDSGDNQAPVRLAQRDGRDGERGGRGGRGGEGGDRAGRRAEIRERVQAKIQSYLAVELASRAGLDQTKSVQLGTAIKAQMERKQQLQQTRKGHVAKLRELLEAKAPDAAVKAQLKLVLDSKQQGHQALLDETARFLTPTEQAKVMLALPEVMKDARRLVRDARAERRGGGGGGRR